MRKLRLILLFLTVVAINIKAQSSSPDFRHITESDGLSSNQVRAIIQDRFGYVWMGTDQGLDRYDGTVFRNYVFGDSFRGSTVLSLHEDGPVIWIGTDKGLVSYSYATDGLFLKRLKKACAFRVTS